ncbi:hypothetical protein [Rhizobium sp. BK251]|uniref:hypothetical protein n=1 Tax=Rhizobium sp. BK251 TaxID=2512125 RepID=UPI00104E30D6|nr:hypothetical protein [Rhizobium sp. BK251]TCL67306.1 hypothetical protein EV286_110211 [Rhizobium sp. BK251]
MKLKLLAALALLPLAACAKRPDAIVPAEIPMAAYQNDACQQLAAGLAKEKATLHALSQKQNDAANGDAFGVFLIGVPITSLAGGDKEGDIAVSKGKVTAMESAMHSKKCG